MTSRTNLPCSPAAERNRGPILEVLSQRLPQRARVLEIGAGTGQHAVAFTSAMPGLSWLPTDLEPALEGLAARVRCEGGDGLLPPVRLDVQQDDWPEGPFDAVFTANTAHIMPWAAVRAMIDGVGRVLTPGGRWFVYGPFRREGRHTSPGNEQFDRSLRAADPDQGIRDLEALEDAAADHRLETAEILAMPANNLIAIFERHE